MTATTQLKQQLSAIDKAIAGAYRDKGLAKTDVARVAACAVIRHLVAQRARVGAALVSRGK